MGISPRWLCLQPPGHGACTVAPGAGSPPGAQGTGQGSSVCSCPVSHLHPCPLSCCRGVIFAEECAVPSDSRGLQGLCYNARGRDPGPRAINIAPPLGAACGTTAPSSSRGCPPAPTAPCPGGTGRGFAPPAPPPAPLRHRVHFPLCPLRPVPRPRGAGSRAGRAGRRCPLPSHPVPGTRSQGHIAVLRPRVLCLQRAPCARASF